MLEVAMEEVLESAPGPEGLLHTHPLPAAAVPGHVAGRVLGLAPGGGGGGGLGSEKAPSMPSWMEDKPNSRRPFGSETM